jgi:hypothetical protein
LAASFWAISAVFLAANPRNVQYALSGWIGGKQEYDFPLFPLSLCVGTA